MVRACKCGCTEIDDDPSRGNAICTSCGAVLEENQIVSEVAFQEMGGGGSSLIGQFCGEGSTRVNLGANMHGGRESRDITIQNTSRKMNEVASQLRLNKSSVDTALNFYKMALNKNLTKGRKLELVIGSCLYMSCRLDQQTLLLLDFSDAVQQNVFELGRTVSILCRGLYISLPTTDPCVYVIRFAHNLQYGNKTQEVANLALRLVSRMKRDWMAIGRRPTGICGAALLLASRYHQFNRTVADIVRVVHVGESVLRKRLDEFKETPSAELTLEEFESVDLESSADPPAFARARLEPKYPTEFEEQLEPMAAEIDHVLRAEAQRKLTKGALSKLIGCSTQDMDLPDQAATFVEEEILQSIDDSTNGRSTPESAGAVQGEQTEVYRGPTLHSLGIATHPVVQPSTSHAHAGGVQENEESLSDIDDSEIECYLLKEEEIQIKTAYWMNAHGSFVEQAEIKRKAREAEAEANPGRKQTNRRKKKTEHTASTSMEAMAMVIQFQEKKLSTKINYEVLRAQDGSRSPSPSPQTNTHYTNTNNNHIHNKLIKKQDDLGQGHSGLVLEASTSASSSPIRARTILDKDGFKRPAKPSPKKQLPAAHIGVGLLPELPSTESNPMFALAAGLDKEKMRKVEGDVTGDEAAGGGLAPKRRRLTKAKVNLGAAGRR